MTKISLKICPFEINCAFLDGINAVNSFFCQIKFSRYNETTASRGEYAMDIKKKKKKEEEEKKNFESEKHHRDIRP